MLKFNETSVSKIEHSKKDIKYQFSIDTKNFMIGLHFMLFGLIIVKVYIIIQFVFLALQKDLVESYLCCCHFGRN